MRALIVDDDFISKEIMKSMLAQLKVEVHTADSAAEAFRLVQVHRYDYIFLDQELPDAIGTELKEALAPYCAERCSFAMVSSTDASELIERCQQVGISHCLTKPVNPKQLADLMGITGGIE
ncbi:response regulator [Pseudidiomarina taiwanensis]|uniref:Response regulatory domain-containing protein n=1 Tax=Pseudidiomarina taiwanensis TaxID=337250 RepID=A0A432ZME0_9GAMM|nr:response regulator [Pseudidiomarina taiwanensis]RUO79047.1 hypothetical protein CWI83_00560 [Pseudidiomarina taiwanensis]